MHLAVKVSFFFEHRSAEILGEFQLSEHSLSQVCERRFRVKEEKQDGLFQLTGHVMVISLHPAPSVNGTCMTHFSRPHRHFCKQCWPGRPGWGWKEMDWHATLC